MCQRSVAGKMQRAANEFVVLVERKRKVAPLVSTKQREASGSEHSRVHTNDKAMVDSLDL